MNRPIVRTPTPAIGLYLILVLLLLISGALLFYWKIGFSIPDVLEYYLGSETRLQLYPEGPDRFMRPRTLRGLSEIAFAHFLAFGTLIFILTHFAHSLSGGRHGHLRRFLTVLFLSGALEVVSGYLVYAGAVLIRWTGTHEWIPLLAAVRIAVFVLFYGMLLICIGWVIRLLYSENAGEH
ncbi:MAG: hypothetical protein KDK34_20800 [Leptospiraceae bacterium]|nr:hypothetical protein [Leptospiraceae bacterium]